MSLCVVLHPYIACTLHRDCVIPLGSWIVHMVNRQGHVKALLILFLASTLVHVYVHLTVASAMCVRACCVARPCKTALQCAMSPSPLLAEGPKLCEEAVEASLIPMLLTNIDGARTYATGLRFTRPFFIQKVCTVCADSIGRLIYRTTCKTAWLCLTSFPTHPR